MRRQQARLPSICVRQKILDDVWRWVAEVYHKVRYRNALGQIRHAAEMLENLRKKNPLPATI